MPLAYIRVPPTKTLIAGKGDNLREEITKDVQDWSRGEVILLLRKDAAEEVARQIRLDNPPAFAVIDKTKGKPLREAVRTVDISFGNALKAKALAVVENELRRAIMRSTKRKSGKLADMSNWKWSYSRGSFPVVGASGIPMGPKDFVVLSPRGVAHETVANRRVAKEGGALSSKRKSKDGSKPPPAPGMGFMRFAARRAGKHPLLRAFRVVVRLSSRHAVPGELSKRKETYSIMIRPNIGKGRRG